jgi:hypothetical protein
MMVRKIKNSSLKPDQIIENNRPIKLVLPEELKSGLSRTIGMPSTKVILNKSRSSSSLKKSLNPSHSSNITPLSKKLRNMSYLMGTTPDIQENLSESISNDDQRHRLLGKLENWLTEQKKVCNKFEIFIDALKKIPSYDPCLKKIVDDIVNGINFHLNHKKTEEDPEKNEEFKKTLAEVIQERNKLKKELERMTSCLKFFKNKKEVPIDQYIQEFLEFDRNSRKKTLKKEEKPRVQSVPKLIIGHTGEIGFHQEFMAKVNEFSDSWRALIKQEKNQ